MRENGYSLEQLLLWCVDDGLIDEFACELDEVAITRGDDRRQLSRPDAVQYLKDLFRSESHTVGQADPQLRSS